MNNKNQILEQARELAPRNYELEQLLSTYDEKIEKWDRDVKRVLNKMKQKTYDILNPKD